MALDRVRLSFDLFISGFVSTNPEPRCATFERIQTDAVAKGWQMPLKREGQNCPVGVNLGVAFAGHSQEWCQRKVEMSGFLPY